MNLKTPQLRQIASFLAPIAVLGLSVVAFVDARSDEGRNSAEAYHAEIRQVAATIPLTIDDPETGGRWVGRDIDVPYEAIEILKPNVMLSRQFLHEVDGQPTGKAVSFMLVHCRDAREIAGHYPPICYPGQGWRIIDQREQQWVVSNDIAPAGMEYEMALATFDRFSNSAISNFMIIPGDGFGKDMGSIRQVSSDLKRRFYGAGQVQVIFDAMTTSPEERKRLTELFLGHHTDLIEQIIEQPG